mmetsp:Transcript_35552/g.78902  ORF Transcript_35552/g.78902 Transcript_35552/m.78902 type:complete len:216 (-) Transcript_35552:245-892(-)
MSFDVHSISWALPWRLVPWCPVILHPKLGTFALSDHSSQHLGAGPHSLLLAGGVLAPAVAAAARRSTACTSPYTGPHASATRDIHWRTPGNLARISSMSVPCLALLSMHSCSSSQQHSRSGSDTWLPVMKGCAPFLSQPPSRALSDSCSTPRASRATSSLPTMPSLCAMTLLNMSLAHPARMLEWYQCSPESTRARAWRQDLGYQFSGVLYLVAR